MLYEIKSYSWGAVCKQKRQTIGFLSRYMMIHILDQAISGISGQTSAHWLHYISSSVINHSRRCRKCRLCWVCFSNQEFHFSSCLRSGSISSPALLLPVYACTEGIGKSCSRWTLLTDIVSVDLVVWSWGVESGHKLGWNVSGFRRAERTSQISSYPFWVLVFVTIIQWL